ncbi:unnamed protein product [Euphydryas editha]|uniref:THAP-type domain-containing protein n=1 Tax=Euphydryas editha TaxID=104508 RepID=A0AAU9UZ99_EUPED|nr:unnamed protein product [Euphydryas editha]
MEYPSTSGDHNNTCNIPKKSRVDSCFVPMCPSTSKKFPKKLFLTGPSDPKLRKKWFQAAKRNDSYSPKTIIRCCEDHFDLENDVENWIKFKMCGGKLFLKKDVVPHIFECQNRMMPLKPRSVIMKRKRREILESIEKKPDPSSESSFTETHGSQNIEISNDKGVQVSIYSYKRSKQVQAEMKTTQKTVALSPKRVNIRDHKTSPIKLNMYKIIYSNDSSDSDSIRSLFKPEEETDSTSESVLSGCKQLKQRQLCDITMGRIMAQPQLYIGVPLSSIILVELLQKYLKCNLFHICLVLKKLRLNEPFSILAEDFDIHETTASRIFSRICWKIAEILKKLIIKPSRETVLANLPISFRNSYSKTYCIIDCLEIEIEVPSDAVHQALTYSSYKKCNTIKHLISSTPDGVINFVSDGFGGRTSDLKIFEESGFMDILPPGACIMADRGFKHIEGVLTKKQFHLIRPPSVSNTKKTSKDEVLRSKKIASLRIHIERVIRRLREFAFLKPHACVDHFLIPHLDYSIIICCALVNLQAPLIKIE